MFGILYFEDGFLPPVIAAGFGFGGNNILTSGVVGLIHNNEHCLLPKMLLQYLEMFNNI